MQVYYQVVSKATRGLGNVGPIASFIRLMPGYHLPPWVSDCITLESRVVLSSEDVC